MRKMDSCILPAVLLSIFVFSIHSFAADFNVFVAEGGENQTITIQNNTGFAVYVYDFLKQDGTGIGVHAEIADAVTVPAVGDIGGIVAARCLSAVDPSEPIAGYEGTPESDGFYHFTAAAGQ